MAKSPGWQEKVRHMCFIIITEISGSYGYDLVSFGILTAIFFLGIAASISRREGRKALKRTLKTVIEHLNISHALI